MIGKSIIAVLAFSLLGAISSAQAQTVMMSAEWAQQACEAWNANPTLTEGLIESGWVDNNADRGYKVMQLYRTDCHDAPNVEMRISRQDDKAICVYGGGIETTELNKKADYIMHAVTKRWLEMGQGEYGPMKAMMFGRLKFAGPKMEAMKNMGPFSEFLLINGKVVSNAEVCPE